MEQQLTLTSVSLHHYIRPIVRLLHIQLVTIKHSIYCETNVAKELLHIMYIVIRATIATTDYSANSGTIKFHPSFVSVLSGMFSWKETPWRAEQVYLLTFYLTHVPAFCPPYVSACTSACESLCACFVCVCVCVSVCLPVCLSVSCESTIHTTYPLPHPYPVHYLWCSIAQCKHFT